MTLSGRNRDRVGVARDGEMGRKVFSPSAEVLGGHTRTVIRGISENAEDTVGEKTCDRHCHSGEPLHEKVDRVPAIKFKGGTCPFSGISPRVAVIDPESKGVQRKVTRGVRGETHMLMKTIPSDHTSAARGEYVGATLFLHSISKNRGAIMFSELENERVRGHTVAHIWC